MRTLILYDDRHVAHDTGIDLDNPDIEEIQVVIYNGYETAIIKYAFGGEWWTHEHTRGYAYSDDYDGDYTLVSKARGIDLRDDLWWWTCPDPRGRMSIAAGEHRRWVAEDA